MSTSNTAALTRSHAVYTAKKRAKKAQIAEVVFDEDARREYLTGFRKRNLLKKEAKVKNAKERERVERLAMRKEHRRELAERAAQNVMEVEGALGATLPGAWDTFDTVSGTIQHEAREFEDEEQVAVVTVVEDFTTESLAHPPRTADSPDTAAKLRAPDVHAKPKLKDRKKRFSYETKAGRRAERTKQRARRTEKAERAGGGKKR